MISNQRVIFKDNATLIDLSNDLGGFLSGSYALPIVSAQDALYIGSDLPFNHRWVEVSDVNDQTASVSVSLWNGSSWVGAVDVVDETSVGGKTLAQSGIISWVPDRDSGSWSRQDKTSGISDLSTLKIYDLYWAKITFSADLKLTTALSYIGYKFSSDTELVSEYPTLASSNLKTAYKAGKTTWDEQSFSAAEYIIQDLKKMEVIQSSSQILDANTFTKASIHKTAQIIFSAFGDDYENELKEAGVKYKDSLNIKMFNVDRNQNASLEPQEKRQTVGWLER